MPTYVYRREDGTTFDVRQNITEDPLDECPETGQSVERIITGSPGVITGSGSDRQNKDASDAPSGPSCCGPVCGF